MNHPTGIPQEPLSQAHITGDLNDSDHQLSPETELWDPFERWQRLADDLLRDWPAGRFRAKKN